MYQLSIVFTHLPGVSHLLGDLKWVQDWPLALKLSPELDFKTELIHLSKPLSFLTLPRGYTVKHLKQKQQQKYFLHSLSCVFVLNRGKKIPVLYQTNHDRIKSLEIPSVSSQLESESTSVEFKTTATSWPNAYAEGGESHEGMQTLRWLLITSTSWCSHLCVCHCP